MGPFDFFTGTKRPQAGTPVLSGQQVRERLLPLNRPTAPWHIVEGANEGVDAVAEWRFQEKVYEDALHRSDRSVVFRILLKLDEAAHEVRAVDREYQVRWGVDGLKLTLAVSGFRGQKQTFVRRPGPLHRAIAVGREG